MWGRAKVLILWYNPQLMVQNRLFVLRLLGWISVVFILIGCRLGDEPTATPAPAVTTAPSRATTPTIPPIPSATATVVPIVTHTSPAPAIELPAQRLTEDGLVQIERLVVVEPSWLVVQNGLDGGELLNVVQMDAGIYTDLTIPINPYLVHEQIVVALYAGTAETFDATEVTLLLSQEVAVTVDVPMPAIIVADQQLWEDGVILIDSVTATEPSWVVVADASTPENQYGMSFIEPGSHQNVPVTIPWRRAVPDLQASLWRDGGQVGIFDPNGEDMPVEVAGNPVFAQFHATFLPELLIYEQPVFDNKIQVERVVSDGAGWLVIYRSENGQPDNVIGFTPLQDGVNLNLVVPVVRSAITPLLFARFHEDTGELGEFEFPNEDLLKPFFDQNGDRYFPQFPFRTDYGNYLIVADQSADEGVVIDQLVVNIPVWVNVYGDEDGERGELIGQLKMPAGYHQEFVVPVDAGKLTDTITIALYRDEGTVDEFDELDFPLREEDVPIILPILITDDS